MLHVTLRSATVIALALLALVPATGAQTRERRPRMADLLCYTRSDYTRFVVQFTGMAEEVTWEDHVYENNPRVFYIDFYNLRPYFADQDLEIDDGLLQRVQVRNYPAQNAIRIIFYLQNLSEFSRYETPRADGRSLVINLLRRNVTTSAIAETTTRQLTSGTRRVVVIDPGHGGSDGGAQSARAIGGRIRREKDVVLEISRLVQQRLNETGHFEAVLTRSGDRHMSLGERVAYAVHMDGDMFVSIHANHAGNPDRYQEARGLELFYLSDRGVANHTGALVEQLSQSRGGSSRDLQEVVLSRARQQVIQSYTICEYLRWAFRRHRYWRERSRGGEGHFRFIEDRNFHVLRNFAMPCVLVETGYMTHSQECALLISREFQEIVAQNIVDGIVRYYIDREEEASRRQSRGAN